MDTIQFSGNHVFYVASLKLVALISSCILSLKFSVSMADILSKWMLATVFRNSVGE